MDDLVAAFQLVSIVHWLNLLIQLIAFIYLFCYVCFNKAISILKSQLVWDLVTDLEHLVSWCALVRNTRQNFNLMRLIVNVVLKFLTFGLGDKFLVDIANHVFECSVLYFRTTLFFFLILLSSTFLLFWLFILVVWFLLRCLVFIRLRFLLLFGVLNKRLLSIISVRHRIIINQQHLSLEWTIWNDHWGELIRLI